MAWRCSECGCSREQASLRHRRQGLRALGTNARTCSPDCSRARDALSREEWRRERSNGPPREPDHGPGWHCSECGSDWETARKRRIRLGLLTSRRDRTCSPKCSAARELRRHIERYGVPERWKGRSFSGRRSTVTTARRTAVSRKKGRPASLAEAGCPRTYRSTKMTNTSMTALISTATASTILMGAFWSSTARPPGADRESCGAVPRSYSWDQPTPRGPTGSCESPEGRPGDSPGGLLPFQARWYGRYRSGPVFLAKSGRHPGSSQPAPDEVRGATVVSGL